jgi:hypothetical protein
MVLAYKGQAQPVSMDTIPVQDAESKQALITLEPNTDLKGYLLLCSDQKAWSLKGQNLPTRYFSPHTLSLPCLHAD